MRIMISPKAALFRIREAETNTSWSISAWVMRPTVLRSPRWCIVASTIITAPSTIRPKSMAPSDIRLADTPNNCIMPSAKSIESGIAEATINPARRLPRNSTSTKTTISAPSIRLVCTVLMARSTKSVRSRNDSISMSAGSDLRMVSIFTFTLLTTSKLLEPFSIMTTPPTASFWPL